MSRVGPTPMGDDAGESKRGWGLVKETSPFCLLSSSRIGWEISGDLDGNPIVSCFLACGILFGCLSLYFNLRWLLPSAPISTTISSPAPLLSLPHNSSSSEPMAVVATAAPDSSPQFHVLAVDDSLIDRKLIEKLLKTSSYQVTAVDSGRKALEFLGLQDEQMDPPALSHTQDIEVHLIITDYWMPGMTGYDLLKKIKNSSSLKDIPVVIMSSENVPSRINRCLQEGAEEFFLKPVQLSDVKKLQPHLLKGKPREQSQPQHKQQLLPPLQHHQQPQPLPLLLQQQPQTQQLLQQEFCNKRKAIDECISMTNTRQRCEGKDEVLCNVSDTPSLVKRVFSFH